MHATSETALRAIMKADETITPEQAEEAIAAAKGKAGKPTMTDTGMKRAEVAKVLGIHPQTVTLYAKRGLIRPLCGGASGARTTLYSAASVEAFLAGKPNAKGKVVR